MWVGDRCGAANRMKAVTAGLRLLSRHRPFSDGQSPSYSVLLWCEGHVRPHSSPGQNSVGTGGQNSVGANTNATGFVSRLISKYSNGESETAPKKSKLPGVLPPLPGTLAAAAPEHDNTLLIFWTVRIVDESRACGFPKCQVRRPRAA